VFILTKKEEFLGIFNELEQYLRIEYNNGKYSETGFMSTLYKIRSRKSNSLIANKRNFDLLSQAAQLRNIMVHNENIAIPTDDFLIEFKSTVHHIIHPKKLYQVMKPIHKTKFAVLEDTLDKVFAYMKEFDFSNIPVIENNVLLGVFTERTLFHYLQMNNDGVIQKQMKMKDLLTSMDLDNDPAKYFSFISKRLDIYQALDAFGRDFEKDQELELLFVTENGNPTDKILGIVTIWDLKQAFLEND
jgi:CBS domain-containing protein